MDNDDDIVRDDSVVNSDLTSEPAGSAVELGLGSLLSQLQTAHVRIEDRIQQLEEVVSRARQSIRRRQSENPTPERSNVVAVETSGFVGNDSGGGNGEDRVGLERNAERSNSCNQDNSSLLSRALEMDFDDKEGGDGGGCYDCNICLGRAKEPIVTCCGHLFCWACFYQLQYVDSTAKECPVCKGEVVDANITPIYGNANDNHVSELESGLKIPPRPPAHRVESVRQQRVSRSISNTPVAEALRRIRIGIAASSEHLRQQDSNGATGEQSSRRVSDIPVAEALRRIRIAIAATDEQPTMQDLDSGTAEQPRQQNLNNVTAGSSTNFQVSTNAEARGNRPISHIPLAEVIGRIRIGLSETAEQLRHQDLDNATSGSDPTLQVMTNAEAGGIWRLRSLQFSRVISESAASVSFALNDTDGIVEGLENLIHDRLQQRTDSQFIPVNNDGDLLSNSFAVTETELQTVDTATETNFAVTLPSSSGRTHPSTAVSPLENPETDSAVSPLENPETDSAVSGHLIVPHRLSSRRRSSASRVSDIENDVYQEPRRRRLR